LLCDWRFIVRIGVPIWEDRVSPVLDAAERLLVVDVEGSVLVRSALRLLDGPHAARVAGTIRNAGVDVLICGAVSEEVGRLIASTGTEIVPWVTGPADEVVRAYVDGTLADARYGLPGCRRGMGARRRRGRGGRSGTGKGRR